MNRLLFLLSGFIITFCACQKNSSPIVVEGKDYQKGESFLYNQNDSAFYYFNKVVTSSSDSLEVAMAYNNMAVIQSDAGDYFGSQESLLTSLNFLDETREKHRWCLASNYNELGITSLNLLNYDQAITYCNTAIKFSDDKEFRLTILNNKALVYRKKKNYPEALKLYRQIIAGVGKEPLSYARVLTNATKTKWLQNPDYDAAPELLRALQIRTQENDVWGQNSSYFHLSDYYTLSRPDSALFYAKSMYEVAKQLESPGDQLEALQKLISLSPPQSVKRYFSIYQALSDSVQHARSAAKNQFALIRYEAEKHEADNLRLQKDNTRKEYQVISAIALLMAVSVSFVFWYRKRKQRLHLEAQNAIKENQLRISKRVHDVVANGLYRMMSEIENGGEVNKDHLLDKIEDMYERSRDLSYEKPEFATDDFHETIARLVKTFANETTKVLLQGNSRDLWQNTTEHTRQEVGHILQELMVNMKKHSQARNVLVKFAHHDNRIHITYSDDGIGFPKDLKHGNGLTNTGNRIQGIEGTITFDRNTGSGITITISFPVYLKDQACSKAY